MSKQTEKVEDIKTEETKNIAIVEQETGTDIIVEEKEGNFDKMIHSFNKLFSKDAKKEKLEPLLLEENQVLLKDGIAFTNNYQNMKHSGYKLIKDNVILIVPVGTDINNLEDSSILQYLLYGEFWAINVKKEVIEKTKIKLIEEK